MANTNAPFGFRRIGVSNASSPTFGLSTLRLPYNASAVYTGDPVEWAVNTPTGYIKIAAPGDVPGSYNNSLAGIFVGCKYLSTVQKRTVWSNYWPGTDTAYDVEAYVVTDPQARFVVQAGASITISGTNSLITQGYQGRAVTFNIGTPSTATGLSGAYVETVGTSGEFIIHDMVTFPPGGPGTDQTASYNHLIVGFNDQWLAGSPRTGIS
jgi:hypothetical protein